MSKEIGPREKQLREWREARAGRQPNPFEDAARGREPVNIGGDHFEDSSRSKPKNPAGRISRPHPSQPEPEVEAGKNIPAGARAKPVKPPGKVKNNPVAKEPKASGHNRLDGPQGTSHRGSSRLRAGRTAQDAAASSDVGRVAIRGRPKKGETRDKPWLSEGMSRASWYRRKKDKAK